MELATRGSLFILDAERVFCRSLIILMAGAHKKKHIDEASQHGPRQPSPQLLPMLTQHRPHASPDLKVPPCK